MQNRLNLLSFVTFALFFILLSRFFYWQVIKSEELKQLSQPQHIRKSVEAAYRGKILASDGSILVGQADSWNLFAEPINIDNGEGLAKDLAPLLVEDANDSKAVREEEQRIKDAISDKSKYWVSLKNRLPSDTKEKIDDMDLYGIGFDWNETRKYPESSASAHLLGFLGKDEKNQNIGYFGLEGYYDKTLTSSYGIQKAEADVKGLPILIGKSKKIPSYLGADLVTYIDKGVQFIVESELKDGIERYGAVNGSVIVMDPSSGGILAMSTFPNFDPSIYWEYTNDVFLNPVISASFEPGSIFKIITMASALDLGVVTPDTECERCSGPLVVGEYSIHTWNDKYFPNSTMTDVIVHSDNVGMSYVAGKIGIEKNYEYLKKFGLGEKTDIDLQGEVSPSLRKKSEWSEIDLYTSSFGQGIAVTPIQMIAAANVIANNGVFIKPKVVKNLVINNSYYDVSKEDPGKRIISDKAATQMKLMMVEAAKNGESKWTYKKGFGVAGKTGTAQIPIAGHYDDEKTIASFVGFAPYENPKFIMLVVLQEPKSSPWASETAAPLWYKIAEKLFLRFGILPGK